MWIDISMPLYEGMPVYSGHEKFEKKVLNTVEADGYTLSCFTMGAHCGTHTDAPMHFVAGGATIEKMDVNDLCGKCVIFTPSEPGAIDAVPAGTRRAIMRAKGLFGGLSVEEAQLLFDKGVRLIGTDDMSIAPSDNESAVHRVFLENGGCVLENLVLDDVADGEWELVALPLKLMEFEGAPTRAMVRR